MELISFVFTDARFRVEEYLGSLDCGVQRLGQGLQQQDFQGKFEKEVTVTGTITITITITMINTRNDLHLVEVTKLS